MPSPSLTMSTAFVRAPVSPPLSPKKIEKEYILPISTQNAIPTRSTRWADGLRGISSLFVLSSHLVLSFDRSLVLPSESVKGPTKLFQRPIFRLISQGQAFVAIFFILLGYVNSLKVIKLSRQGKTSEALSSLTIASFRRTGRLVFPAATVTVLAWLATQMGAFELARRSDAYWLATNSPEPSKSWALAVKDLVRELVWGTWVQGENRYDQPQWALLRLFKGSMFVFMFLLATVRVTPRARMVALIALYFWSWAVYDALIGPNVIAGIFLAELTYLDGPVLPISIPRLLTRLIPYFLLPIALVLMSFPSSYAHQATWSSSLTTLALYVFPTTTSYPSSSVDPNTSSDPSIIVSPAIDLGRAWPAIGAQLLCGCILFSDGLRRTFSWSPFHWLGGVSYTIYLLHGPLMRSLLAHMVFSPTLQTFCSFFASSTASSSSSSSSTPVPDHSDPTIVDSLSLDMLIKPGSSSASPLPPPIADPATATTIVADTAVDPTGPTLPSSPTQLLLTILIFLPLLLAVVALWSRRVEPLFGRLMSTVERLCLPSRPEHLGATTAAAAAAAPTTAATAFVGDGVWIRSRSSSSYSSAAGGEEARSADEDDEKKAPRIRGRARTLTSTTLTAQPNRLVALVWSRFGQSARAKGMGMGVGGKESWC